MLQLEALHIRQGDFSLRADFAVAQGIKLAIIGPSGGGKSTLLSTIAGFVTPVTGRVLLGGTDITHIAPGKRAVSLLFQDNNLFSHLTVFQNTALGVKPDLKLTRDQRLQIHTALDRVGLRSRGDEHPAALSGGQRQRVALARALLRDKPLLMLDEPFAALGPALKADMLDLVDAMVKDNGATLLMVTHEPNDASRIADETVVVADGQASAPKPTDQLFADPPRALAAYLG